MLQRGRKTASTLAPVVTLERIAPPPDGMPADQAKVWAVVARSPVFALIGQESYPLLTEYCRLISSADDVAAQLAAMDSSWLVEDEGLRRWEKLLNLQAKLSGAISSVAMKLRISPSSRNDRDRAATLHKRGAGRKPWEVDNEE